MMNSSNILLFGGLSRERLVSVASAQSLVRLIEQPACWFWAPDGSVREVESDALLAHENCFLAPFEAPGKALGGSLTEALDGLRDRPAVVFVALHGGEGENGTVAGWLEQRGIAFTGSGSAASRLAFDKVAARERVAARGVTVAEADVLSAGDEIAYDRLLDLLGHFGEVVVKPVEEGSSYGVEIISSPDEARRFTQQLRDSEYPRYLAERRLTGIELTGGVIHHEGELIALPTVEIRADQGRSFDYRGKYLGEGIREICPAEVGRRIEQATRKASRIAHETLGCFGYSRSDFIVEDGQPVFLETNTLPGLTATSLLPQELRKAGIAVKDFVAGQIELARRRFHHTPRTPNENPRP